jgi:GntR family transcriptional regulator
VIAMTKRDWRPQYVQLAEELRDKIVSGELSADKPMPSETELERTSGMSRTSVRNAIKLLKDWGLVRSRQGQGTYVRAQRQRVRRRNTDRYQWEKDRVRTSEETRRATGGTEYDTGRTIGELRFFAEYSQIAADAELAKRFGVPEGTSLLRREYRTSVDGEEAPLSMSRSYMLQSIAAENPALLDSGNEPWPGGTQHQLFTVGIELDRIVEEITARPPLPEEAEILDLEQGTSVLNIWRASIDTEDKVVEVAHSILPGDRTEMVYTTQLKRWEQ